MTTTAKIKGIVEIFCRLYSEKKFVGQTIFFVWGGGGKGGGGGGGGEGRESNKNLNSIQFLKCLYMSYWIVVTVPVTQFLHLNMRCFTFNKMSSHTVNHMVKVCKSLTYLYNKFDKKQFLIYVYSILD